MLENIKGFFKKIGKKEEVDENTKEAAKERLHLVLMQDRANVSADFLEMMKQEIIDVIKKYVDVDEAEIDVRLTNQINEDGTNGAPALYANIPITGIKNEKNEIKIKNDSENNDNQNKLIEHVNGNNGNNIKSNVEDVVSNKSDDIDKIEKDNLNNKKRIEKEITKKNVKTANSKEKNGEENEEKTKVKKATQKTTKKTSTSIKAKEEKEDEKKVTKRTKSVTKKAETPKKAVTKTTSKK